MGLYTAWYSSVSIIPMQLKILCCDLQSWSLIYNACMQNCRMCNCHNSQHMNSHWTCDLLKKSQLVDCGLRLPYLKPCASYFQGMVKGGVYVTSDITSKKWKLIFKEKLLKKNTDISSIREVGIEVIESELKYSCLGLRRC